MITALEGRDNFVFDAEAGTPRSRESGEPVGNTTFLFEISFADLVDGTNDLADQKLIDSRRSEPTESMESVFARLGL